MKDFQSVLLLISVILILRFAVYPALLLVS